jgi:predicted transcriptional regulator
MLTRQQLLAKLKELLEKYSVDYLDFSEATDIVFDFVVKLQELFIIKVLKDVESLKRDASENLLKVAKSLASSALVVAEFDKKKKIPDNAIGIRYGVPFLNLNTFEKFIQGRKPYIEYTRGGPYIKIKVIDEEKLKEILQKLGASRRRILEIIKNKNARITLAFYRYLENKEVVEVESLDPRELCRLELPDEPQIVSVVKAPHDTSLLRRRRVEILAKIEENSHMEQFLELSDFLNVEALIVKNTRELEKYVKKLFS